MSKDQNSSRSMMSRAEQSASGACQLYFKTFPQFKPDIIVVGFCFSLNGDVSWLLRRCGLSASMFLTHDLRIITKNPRLELNPIQIQLLKEIGNSSLTFKISLEI